MAYPPTIAETLKDEKYEQAAQVVLQLQKAGHKAYFVGGCVRDLFLGLTPKDYDIATDAKPDDVKLLFPKAKGFGKRFGVSLVAIPSGEVEVAAFREDGFYYDHRRPSEVTYAGIAEDAVRRDFTLNALYYDPIQDEIIDLVNGLSDLQTRTLRMIGDPFERFDEDWLRMLRAVRLAARFVLLIEPRTRDALHTLAPMITGVSAERRTEELRLMFQGPHPGRAIGLLYSSGLWEALLPNLLFSKPRIRKAVNLLERSNSPEDIWMHFFVDLPLETVAVVCENLRLTRSEKKSLGIK